MSRPPRGSSVFPATLRRAVAAVLALGDGIRSAYTVAASPILVTKTMLGVFGCIPGFDRFFRLGFGRAVLDRATLTKISDFYTANKSGLHTASVRTFNSPRGRTHAHYYTQAKIIDMIFFQEGYKRTGGN